MEAYLKLSYKAKMKTLLKVGNYIVSVLPGQNNLAQNCLFGLFFFCNCMFFSNSQRVNLAWGISAVLFCVRVLLQCLVGTSRSILGYVV